MTAYEFFVLIDETKNPALKPPAGALDDIAYAVSHQLSYHVNRIWKFTPMKVVVATGADDPLLSNPLAYHCHLVDTLTEAPDALGYHDLQNDVPVSFIGVGVIMQYGGGWLDDPVNGNSVSAVISHEALELKGDENCNVWVDDWKGTLWALELCDPVQATGYYVHTAKAMGYHAVRVSNFILPSWTDPLALSDGESKFDYMGILSSPFSIMVGGYALYSAAGTTQQLQMAAGWDEQGEKPIIQQARMNLRTLRKAGFGRRT